MLHTVPRPSTDAEPRGGRGNVALFVCDLSPTGVVRNTVALAHHLLSQGYHVEIVAAHLVGVGFWSIDPLVRLTALLPGSAATGAASLVRLVPRLHRHLRRTRPDILLSTGNRGHLVCWAASRTLSWLPRIYRISNDLTHARAGASPPTLRDRLSSLLRRAGLRLLVGDAARIAVVSPALMAEPALAGRRHVEPIPNGVDVAAVRRRMLQPVDAVRDLAREPFLLAIGRHAEQKNFATLVAAVGLTNRHMPLRLVILGRGTPETKAELRRIAAAHGIDDRLSLLDPVANPFPYLREAAAFALPSWWEGSSNALLEAMACGTLVIASRTAGNAAQIIGDDHHGLLVDPHDPVAMAAAIRRQVEGPPVHPGERAQAFDLAPTLTRYARLVDDVLREQASRARPAARAPTGLQPHRVRYGRL